MIALAESRRIWLARSAQWLMDCACVKAFNVPRCDTGFVRTLGTKIMSLGRMPDGVGPFNRVTITGCKYCLGWINA